MTQVLGVRSTLTYESHRVQSVTVTLSPSSVSRRASGRLSTRNSTSKVGLSTPWRVRITKSF